MGYQVFLTGHEVRLKENEVRKIETNKRLVELQSTFDETKRKHKAAMELKRGATPPLHLPSSANSPPPQFLL